MNSFAEKQTNRRVVLTSTCGWSVYNYRLHVVKFLIAKNFEVHVIAGEDKFLNYLTDEGCIIHKIKINNRGLNILQDFKLFFNLLRLYRKIKPLLVFHYFVKPNIYGTFAAAVAKVTSVAVVAGLGYSFNKKNWLQFLVRLLYKLSLKNSYQVWFQNSEDADLFLKYKMVASRQLKIIPGDGIATTLISPIENKMNVVRPFTFIMAVRLLKSKGIQYYAAASKLLLEKGVEFDCQLIGKFEINHPDSISAEQLQEWQNNGLISYHGFIEDVRSRLAKSDCLVLPTYYNEGTPRSIMEACCMELPVITTDSKGCSNIVQDGYNGFLCKPKNAKDLAAKMEEMILLQKNERIQMGQNGRRKMIDEYDIEILFRVYQSVLDSIIPSKQIA